MTLSQRPRRLRAAAAAAAATAVGLLAACSSTSSTGAGAESQSSSGSPVVSATAPAPNSHAIRLGIIASAGTAVNQAPAVAAAQAAVRDVNAHGGIDGRQVQLIFCNEGLDPNQARACARTLVSDHVMAAVGNQVVTVEADVNTILRDAGIPNVAPFSYSGASGTDPNSSLIYPGPQYANAAMAAFAVRAGYKKVAMLNLGIPATQAYEPLISKAVRGLGGTYAGTVTVPQVTSDLSTQAASLVSMSPNAVILDAGTPAELALIRDMRQLGYTGKFIADGGQPELQSQLTALGSAASSFLSVSSFPPLSSTKVHGISQFLRDMAAEKAAGDTNAPTATGYVANNDIDAWLSVIAVAKVADAAKAKDAPALKAALAKASNVDLDGVVPSWTPGKRAPTGAVFPRATDGTFYFTQWRDGLMSPAGVGTTDVTSLVNRYAPRP